MEVVVTTGLKEDMEVVVITGLKEDMKVVVTQMRGRT